MFREHLPFRIAADQTRGTNKERSAGCFFINIVTGFNQRRRSKPKIYDSGKSRSCQDAVEIRAGQFFSYHGTLETVEGHQVWSGQKLKVQKGARFLTVSIPSRLLKKADYILTLKGTNSEGIYENVESYSFTILR